MVEFNGVETKGVHNSHGGSVSFIVGEVIELASSSQNVDVERRSIMEVDKADESIGISLRDLASFDSLGEVESEGVLTEELPAALEVRLRGDLGSNFVGEHEVLFLNDLRGELAEGHVLLSESFTTFRGGSVHTEDEVSVLVGVGERVKDLIALLLILVALEQVTTVSEPIGLRDFVVEKTSRGTLTPLLKAEPGDDVGFNSFTSKLHRGPFGGSVVHGILPSLSGVVVDLPSVSLSGGGPVGNGETLVDGSGSSVEGNISDSLKKSVRVEVLSIDVVHDIGLLVELVVVNILDTHTDITGLLDMESVGDEEEVGVHEFHDVGH